jgi:glycosyltransferase involved in cell wall biosynthesis
MLERAVASVKAQTFAPSGGLSVALDVDHAGAAINRQRALDGVRTEWVAFLDDDDTFYPQHLEALSKLQVDTDADYVWSWFDGNDPFPMHRGKQMDPANPHHTTMTIMCRTELARASGFAQPDGPMHQDWAGEDWQFIVRCVNSGAKFATTEEITWTYQLHGTHTSGLSNRW